LLGAPADRRSRPTSTLTTFRRARRELIRRINRTNSVTELEPGLTLTDALARRDVLRLRRRLYAEVA
jgi:hypothetical protein